MGEAPPSARFCSVPPYERVGSVSFGPGLFSWPINAFQMYQLVLEMYEVVFEMHIREPRRKRNLSWRGDPPTNARRQRTTVWMGEKRFFWPIASSMYQVVFDMYEVIGRR